VKWYADKAMSEFKFACSVCGQHITADSSHSGGQLDCPTCYQKLVIPQAPTSSDPKFIITASQVGKPRPIKTDAAGNFIPPVAGKSGPIVMAVLVLLLGGLGAAGYVFRHKLFPDKQPPPAQAQPGGVAVKKAPVVTPMTVYAVPTNFAWTLDLSQASPPETPAAGQIHGKGFSCERAILQGGTLNLRQGASGLADLGLSVHFFATLGEELSGKTIEIAPDRAPPVPKVVLRWKNELGKAVTRNINDGYALKVTFAEAAAGRIKGKLYLCAPDEDKSFAAGSFDAEIRKPTPPKPKQPKTPKSKAPRPVPQ
jgi:hypothetical protein